MKTLLIALSTLLLLPLSTTSQVASTQKPPTTETASASTSAADVQLFTNLIQEVMTSIENQDMDALGKLMAPKYVHYNPNGGTDHKDDELAFIKTWDPTTVKLTGPAHVSRSGDMAVTVSQHAYVFGFTQNEREVSRTVQHMIMWVPRDGHWQMAVVQSKDIKA